jgi:sulfhydrogenase subunit alpha
MSKRLTPQKIHIDYLARVEGETSLLLKVGKEKVEEIKLKIFEPPRFFEGFLVGRKYDEVGDIVSRICGICPISHMLTAILAVEDAMGIIPSGQTKKLRRLMSISQIVASHIVHLYMLALPDYKGYTGFLPMVPDYPVEAADFLEMKQAVNHVAGVIGGRPLHPVSMVVKGFTKPPSMQDLENLASGIRKVLPSARRTVELMAGLPCPDLRPETEFVAIRTPEEYAISEGRLVSSRGLDVDIHDYPSHFQEKQVRYAMAKKSFLKTGSSFMVGALSRMNLKFEQFHQETKDLAGKLGVAVPNTNPFRNNLAQALEIYDGMVESIRLLEEITPSKEDLRVTVRKGEGMALTEAPRGLLMHRYAVNQRGVVEYANMVTPTSHNFANLERDLQLLAAEFSEPDELGDLRSKCEKLIRAYDPCFSCSVH